MVVAKACRDVVVGGDVVFLLVTSVGIHVTKEDMDLLGRERTLVGELMEEFFCVGPLGEMYDTVRWNGSCHRGEDKVHVADW